MYSILFHRRLSASWRESLGHTFFRGLEGLCFHVEKTKAKAGTYMVFFPMLQQQVYLGRQVGVLCGEGGPSCCWKAGVDRPVGSGGEERAVGWHVGVRSDQRKHARRVLGAGHRFLREGPEEAVILEELRGGG